MVALINDTGILVVVIALVMLFGASQIPKLARSLGEANKEFRKATHDPAVSAPDAHMAEVPGAETVTISRRQLDALLAQRGDRSDQPTHIA